MPSVPAFCDTCSTVFNSGFFVENSTNISFSGNRSGPCPKCGGMGHVPDGVFNFIGNTIEILSAPERTISELSRLAQIFRDAKANSETKEQVVSRIEKEIPALSKLAKLLPENRAELYGFLALVLTAAQFFNQPSQLSQTPITVNITQVIQQTMVESPRAQATVPPATTKKPGRNDPCSCGSDAKYKKCCGALK
jgi:hypothetical protein